MTLTREQFIKHFAINAKFNQNLDKKVWQIAKNNNINSINDLNEYFETHFSADNKLFRYYYNYYEVNLYPHPSVTIDLIGLRYSKNLDKLQLLLVKRKHTPFKDKWAFPGGFVNENESVNQAVLREVKEETNIDLNSNQLVRMPCVSKPGRDPRTWVITNPNIVLFSPGDIKDAQAGDDAKDLTWADIKTKDNSFVLEKGFDLAFDHKSILRNALKFLVNDFDHRRLPLVVNLLGSSATSKEFRRLFAHFVPSYKNKLLSSVTYRYHKSLVKEGIKTAPKGSKGGHNQNIYKYQKPVF